MRTIPILASFLTLLLLLPIAGTAQAQNAMPAAPTEFDSKAKSPPDLPKTLDIPKNMRIEVGLWRKAPIHSPKPIDPNNLSVLMDPDLESAVIERGEGDVHATFNWQGDRTSEAYVIRGFCFRKNNLAYPNVVIASDAPMNFWLNRVDNSGESSGSFPGISWYAPSTFVGTASLNGTKVLVFAQDAIKPGTDTYPEGISVCLDSKTHLPLYMDDGVRILTFTYIPSPNVQINPQGFYLKAIQAHFGHYP